MTRYELERHLGKYVEIVLFDGTVIEAFYIKQVKKPLKMTLICQYQSYNISALVGIRLLVIVFLDCPTLKKSVV